ncbi:MAG: leucine-rich repeat protein, partial [Ruminococcus sp.]
MNKKKLRNRILATSLALCFTASALPLSSSAVVNAAQVEDNSIVAAGLYHTLSSSNNYDISKELIMPGESFRIEPQYDVFHTVGYYGQDVTNPWLYNASLELGDVRTISKLVRNTADVSGIEEINDTYNVIKMAYERGDLIGALEQYEECEDPELREELEQALQEALSKETTVTVGYVNNTSTPIVLQQVRTNSTKSEGVLYGGEYGKTPIVEAASTHKSDCTIKFFEPYYTISYEKLLEGEEEGLPDCYYIQRESQTLVLPNLVRPGCHFDKWDGGMYFADQEKVGDTTVLSFDWENNLANASYNFGDETLFPVFDDGYTVTFNPRGGTIDGEKSAIYELDTESESFFDIGDYVPKREGYTFLGWCYKPSALYNSLIEDTSNYDWMNNTSGYDIQLYAKWAEESDEELEANGFRFDEETGELTIITDTGVKGWNDLCFDTNYECNAKVKSLYVGGDVTTVESYLFRDCVNLKSAVLSESVEDIDYYAFSGCSSLENIEMPGVKSISPNAFCDCTSLKSIEMPLIKRIYGNAFENCTSLETVTLPPQTEYIGEQAFYKCSQLCEVVFERTDYDENEDYFYVSADAFEECHPDLFILVQPSMLNLFKETFMPAYADIITDEVPVREITDVVIYNAPTSCTVGEAPKETATKVDSEAYTFYEYWEEWAQTENGLEPVKYWYSDAQQMSRVPADKRITAFEKGKTYSYSIIAQANENYTFASKDALSVMLNGEDFTAKSEVILDGKSLMIGPGKFMKPVEQKEIEVVEINNATLTFMDGDKPEFTGTTPDGAPYVLVFEEWRTDGEWTRSDEWFNDDDHHGDDKDITA